MTGENAKVYRDTGGDRQVVASGGSIVVQSGGVFDNNGAVANATITVGNESSDVRAIGIQLKDAQGNNLTIRQAVTLYVFADANGDAFSAGGSTGIAIGTDGLLSTLVAKKHFEVISEDNGHIDLTWTDTGTAAAFLGVKLPNGKLVISAAMTNT